jgi:hypothetical protein
MGVGCQNGSGRLYTSVGGAAIWGRRLRIWGRRLRIWGRDDRADMKKKAKIAGARAAAVAK